MKKYFFKISCFLMLAVITLGLGQKTLVQANFNELFPNFTSKSYILIEPNSKTILVNFDENKKMPVASICKLMTALLTFEKIERNELSLDDKIVASEYAASMEGSQAFLDAGSEYTVRDLLKSIVVASANDSSVAIAECIGGSEQNFVKMMNERAKQLGMVNTNYENATGLPTLNQYSTAYDTAIILNKISEFDLYNEDSEIWMDELVHPSGRKTELVNTNRLIKYYDGCINGKTGYTPEAGYCLSSTVIKNDFKLIAVVLQCKDSSLRFKESMDLYNYGFSNYENKEIVGNNVEIPTSIEIQKSKSNKIKIIPESGYQLITKKGDVNECSVKTEIFKIKAPVKAGDVVGKVYILKDSVVVGEVNLISAENVDKLSYKDALIKMSKNWRF